MVTPSFLIDAWKFSLLPSICQQGQFQACDATQDLMKRG
jgi:hypothetical protein